MPKVPAIKKFSPEMVGQWVEVGYKDKKSSYGIITAVERFGGISSRG